MPLGQQLSDAFQRYVALQPHNTEEELFQCLINAINDMPGYQADSIHGIRRKVEYTERRNWFTKRPARCELADVAIIAYSRLNHRARLILIQNKVSTRNNTDRISADLVQYELLRDRPFFHFTSAPYQGVQNGLIHRSAYPSVCQYGIFYRNRGVVDMSVITAQHLSMKRTHCSNSMNPKRMIYFDGQFQNLANYNPHNDFIAAENIRDFGDLLEQLYIGRPITNRGRQVISNMLFLTPNLQEYPHLEQHVLNFSELQLLEWEENADYLNLQYEDDFRIILNSCRRLILINVDRQDDNNQ